MKSSVIKLSIVIPAYNEARTIHRIFNKVGEVTLINSIEKEIIVVNDCSTDDTEAVLKHYAEGHPELGLQIFHHEINKGKGAALHTGIAKATGDVLIISRCGFGV